MTVPAQQVVDSSMEVVTPKLEKPILISMPTNNCARILLFLKHFGFQDAVEIKSPKDFGGLKLRPCLNH